MSSSPSPSTSKLATDQAENDALKIVQEDSSSLKVPNSDAEEQKEHEDEAEEGSGSPATTNNPTTATVAASESANSTDSTQWQAIWSPEYNAYYFFNATTQQTTWTNPLIPEGAAADADQQPNATSEDKPKEDEEEAESSSGVKQPQMSAIAAQNAAIEAAALAQGIDPLLARLDPSLVASATAPGQSVPGSLPTFTAQFNARTGRFAAVSSSSSSLIPSSGPVRTPAHLSEYERAKRMSSFYFDVDKWEEDLAKRGGRLMGEEGEGVEEDGGKKRKRPSKKDIERFKEQKKQKKIAKTAWLRT